MSLPFQEIRRRWNSRRALSSFVLSYAVVLLLPVILSIAVITTSRAGTKEKMLELNGAALSRCVQVMESVMDSASGIALELSERTQLRAVMHIKNPMTTQERYEIVVAINNMAVSQALMPVPMKYQMYFPEGDFFLMMYARNSVRIAYENYYMNTGLSEEEFRLLLSRRHDRELISLDGSLLYMQTIPYFGRDISANVLVQIDKGKLNERLTDYVETTGSALFVFDSRGNVILESGGEDISPEAVFSAAGDTFEDNTGVRREFSKTKDQHGLTYALVLDDQYVKSTLRSLQDVYAVFISAALVIGLILVAVFSFRNYRPIRAIVSSFERMKIERGSENELSYISSSVDALITLNADMRSEIEAHDEFMKQNALSKLLRGRLMENDTQSASGIFSDFSFDRFYVVLLRVDERSGYDQHTGDVQKRPLDYALIHEFVSWAKNGSCACEVTGMIGCLLSGEGYAGDRELREEVYMFKRKLEEALMIRLTVAVSNAHFSIVGASSAYEEALYAMDTHHPSGDGVVFYADCRDDAEYVYSKETEQALSHAIFAGDAQAAEGVITEIFAQQLSSGAVSMDLIRCLADDIAATFFRILAELNCEDESLAPAKVVLSISRLKKESEIRTYLSEIAVRLSECAEAGKESRNRSLLDEIIQYVNENFRDSSLSNTQIAEAMDISSAYLSRFFKQQTGDGLLEFIQNVRIEETKKRIREGADLNGLFEEVGFTNIATFRRVFKKAEGVTPRQYYDHVHEV